MRSHEDHLPVSLRTSLRFYWRETSPYTYGWPQFRTTLTTAGIIIEPAGRFTRLITGKHRVEARWDELTHVERTQQGIRLVFKDERRPVVVATLWKPERLIRAVQDCCPVRFDPALRRSTWSNV